MTDHAVPTAQETENGRATGPRFIVLMGVSGTGKSTLGRALASAMGLPFVDGDDLHPAANVAKMARGEPLDDADRLPWLEAIRKAAVARVREQVARTESPRGPGEEVEGPRGGDDGDGDEDGDGNADADASGAWRPGVIVACSALKKTYRAVLRGADDARSESLPTYFVHLEGDREALMARLSQRRGHFMKAGMLDGQLDALESPEGEPGVVSVPASMATEAQVCKVVGASRSWG